MADGREGETLAEKVARVVAERVEVVEYDPRWQGMFEAEREHLRACLPGDLVGRIEHFGSTAVEGLAGKPIVDMLVEVFDLERVKREVAGVLEGQGYEYFWRPTWGDDGDPFYAWFIKRDGEGRRTHHIHMVEPGFEHWERLLFRDYLREHVEVAGEYAELKRRLEREHGGARVAYTEAKGEFIRRVTERARGYYGG
ncbi:dephospho-CoA kinase/protein folding accessory domain-containing protein [Anaerohalosphaera lusitana]|uniref:Dephospho-CoA kinase/protein folding accessory domain-containing protein n=1 Tax=Anaerohalosphaera lusitana TaxID=1936003 RepID=A0A1U9NIU3_9BACT|nr:GrpB family protein [Anaerohalosphaera lusitana]AQT67849.1 dephospho-CoA kinase/protein folding accessory domain-containing protein [Anaerohalosphaera lusitana]